MSSFVPVRGEKKPVRVLVADSTAMGNQLLASALDRDRRFQVTVSALDVGEALAAVEAKPHVALVATSLGSQPTGGFELCRRLRTVSPTTKVVMLLDARDRQFVVDAFRSGAKGVLGRSDPLKELWKCIYAVHTGKIWANDEELQFVLEALADNAPARLALEHGAVLVSDREQRLVCCVANGLTNGQIAQKLGLSEHTIKNCLNHLYDRVGVSSRVELVFACLGKASPEDAKVPTGAEMPLWPKDDAAAFAWLSEAARSCFPSAQLALAKMYSEGRGTDQDILSAYMWLLAAESSGSRILLASKSLRSRLISRLSREQVDQAERRLSDWVNQHAVNLNPDWESNRPSRTPMATHHLKQQKVAS